MDVDEDVIPLIAFGLAGGIGNTGAVCGAVSGGAMVIALRLGRATNMEEALARLDLVGEFRRRFEKEMKTISCRELTGLDLSTPEARAELMDSDVARKACFPAVGAAYRIALELLSENE
jgi:C_GCAxxG_C_C family probable redox protein